MPRVITSSVASTSPGSYSACSAYALVQRREVDLGELQEIVDAAKHEIRLLEVVDAIVGAHDARKVEADAIGRRVVQREHAFGEGRRDAGAVDAQAAVLLDQAELDRVPVHARELRQHAQLLRAQAADAVGLDVVRDHRVHEHRDVPEHVVEDVGLLEVVELVRPCG